MAVIRHPLAANREVDREEDVVEGEDSWMLPLSATRETRVQQLAVVVMVVVARTGPVLVGVGVTQVPPRA